MGCIYLATNTKNGKKYVGKSVYCMEVRKTDHIKKALNDSKFALHLAIKKYGQDMFIWETLAESESNEELSSLEMFYIQHHGSVTPNGYNMTMGGDGVTLTAEQRQRKSDNRKALQEKDPLRYELARTVTNRLTDEQKAIKAEKCRQRALEQFKDPEKYARFLEGTRKADRTGPREKKSMTKTKAIKIFADINSAIKKSHRSARDEQAKQDRMNSPGYMAAIHRRTKRPVLCIDTNETFPSAYHAASAKLICRMNITQVCLGKKKSAGGHQWRYVL